MISSLAVANRTIGESLDLDVVFFHQFSAEYELVFRGAVGEIEDFLLRPNVLGRIAVAINAP
jgi:hypothetical protein